MKDRDRVRVDPVPAPLSEGCVVCPGDPVADIGVGGDPVQVDVDPVLCCKVPEDFEEPDDILELGLLKILEDSIDF